MRCAAAIGLRRSAPDCPTLYSPLPSETERAPAIISSQEIVLRSTARGVRMALLKSIAHHLRLAYAISSAYTTMPPPSTASAAA